MTIIWEGMRASKVFRDRKASKAADRVPDTVENRQTDRWKQKEK